MAHKPKIAIQSFGFKIEKDLMDRIREEAKKEERSISKMSGILLREALDARVFGKRQLKPAAGQ